MLDGDDDDDEEQVNAAPAKQAQKQQYVLHSMT